MLINRTHTSTDIYLPIDASEWRLLESFDGRRSIGELLAQHPPREALRSFFERLWWHDQIVLDASQPIASPSSV